MANDKEKVKETTERRRKKTSPEKTIAEMAEEIFTSKKRTRQSESTTSLPLWMFALDDDQIRKLHDSQFDTLLEIGNKIAFSSTLKHKYTIPSAAIQGFTHALQMVVLACSPNVLTTDIGVSSTTGSEDEEPYSVHSVTKPINLYMPIVRRLDNDDKGRHPICAVITSHLKLEAAKIVEVEVE
ncbi:unnamed protein product [Cochlearia groenlandica]